MVVQNGCGHYVLPKPYPIVNYFVMKYFTLEGCYTSMHGYHFPILNHIRYGEMINFPYYIFTCLESYIANGTNPLMHQGLIYIMYKYAFYHSPNHSHLLTLPSNFEPKEETGRSSIEIELIETNPLHMLDIIPMSKSKGKKPRAKKELEILEVALLKINLDKRNLETPKKSLVKARKLDKDTTKKSITIDLDLKDFEKDEERPNKR